MTDIITLEDEKDLGVFDTEVEKAKNILSVQVGSLEYAPDLGIDLAYFLSPDFSFQNESFRAYLVEVLASQGVNTSSIVQSVQSLFNSLEVTVEPTQNNSNLIAR